MLHKGHIFLGEPVVLPTGTQAEIEALPDILQGAMAYATDRLGSPFGTYNGVTWDWEFGYSSIGTGAQEITNFDFVTDADGWTLGTGWAWSAGQVVHTPGNTAPMYQSGLLQDGLFYRAEVIHNGTTGTIEVSLDGGDSLVVAAGVTADFVGKWTDFDALKISIIPSSDYDGSVDVVRIWRQAFLQSPAADGTYGQVFGVWAPVVASVTGDGVDNTDPANPVLTFPTPAEIGAEVSGAAATAETNAKAYADGLVVGLWDDRGSFDASVNAYPSTGGSGTAGAILKGDAWTVSVAGTLPTGQVVEIGDLVRALIDTPGNTQANWAITQNNIGYVAENTANKDISGGYVGKTLEKINFWNTARTFMSFLVNAATAARTYTFPDKDMTVASTDVATTSMAGLAPQATAPAAGLLNVLGIANGETVYSMKELRSIMFEWNNPIGTVRTFGVSTNPNTLLGFGTWTAIPGRVIVGIDATQAEFDTLNETGGAKTHTLATTEIPSHYHLPGTTNNFVEASNSGLGGFWGNTGGTQNVASASTGLTGGGGAHNNLQPFIVKYVWERTA